MCDCRPVACPCPDLGHRQHLTRTLSVRGAREHNLKNVDLEIPRDSLVVFTGLVGVIIAPVHIHPFEGFLAVLAIALVSTVVAMVGFFAGIKRLGAADAATLSTLEPVVTFALAAIFLDEPVTASQMAGGAIVLGAVIALARGQAAPDQDKGSTSSR